VNIPQPEAHIRIGRSNGLSETELIEAFAHLAFYAGRPKALSAIDVAKRVFSKVGGGTLHRVRTARKTTGTSSSSSGPCGPSPSRSSESPTFMSYSNDP
jgi:hypothetical protein